MRKKLLKSGLLCLSFSILVGAFGLSFGKYGETNVKLSVSIQDSKDPVPARYRGCLVCSLGNHDALGRLTCHSYFNATLQSYSSDIASYEAHSVKICPNGPFGRNHQAGGVYLFPLAHNNSLSYFLPIQGNGHMRAHAPLVCVLTRTAEPYDYLASQSKCRLIR